MLQIPDYSRDRAMRLSTAGAGTATFYIIKLPSVNFPWQRMYEVIRKYFPMPSEGNISGRF